MEIGLTPHQSLKIILSIQILYIVINFWLAPSVNINILFFADLAVAILLIAYLNRRAQKNRAGKHILPTLNTFRAILLSLIGFALVVLSVPIGLCCDNTDCIAP